MDEKQAIQMEDDPALALQHAKATDKALLALCESDSEGVNPAHDLFTNTKIVPLIEKTRHDKKKNQLNNKKLKKEEAVWHRIKANTVTGEHFNTLYPVYEYPALYCIDPKNGTVLGAWFGREEFSVEKARSEKLCKAVEWLLTQRQKQKSASNANISADVNVNADTNDASANTTKMTPQEKLEQLRRKAQEQKQKQKENKENGEKTSTLQQSESEKLEQPKEQVKESSNDKPEHNRREISKTKDTTQLESTSTKVENKQTLLSIHWSDDSNADVFSPVIQRFHYDCSLEQLIQFIESTSVISSLRQQKKDVSFVLTCKYPQLSIDPFNSSQWTLIRQQTLEQLHLVPSCRLYVQFASASSLSSAVPTHHSSKSIISYVYDFVQLIIAFLTILLQTLLWLTLFIPRFLLCKHQISPPPSPIAFLLQCFGIQTFRSDSAHSSTNHPYSHHDRNSSHSLQSRRPSSGSNSLTNRRTKRFATIRDLNASGPNQNNGDTDPNHNPDQ
ncbi:hypothetical protein RFI_07398 [Reticulomyxa filosa]|uniref:UBX domain-containing protein n=1 Tax=Reticulomyxa filosa TaxID=46433 RepID=X6NWQ5_RETFI|nr:hypothetical protein RFI_07398 [Reticulomyxa filosa]|eukprot:ETO29722.1 hypothetical protein RFI_07398 [Reticulomyxa filosa]